VIDGVGLRRQLRCLRRWSGDVDHIGGGSAAGVARAGRTWSPSLEPYQQPESARPAQRPDDRPGLRPRTTGV